MGLNSIFFPLVHFVVPFVNTPEVSLVLLLCVLAAERIYNRGIVRVMCTYSGYMVLFNIYKILYR